MEKNTEENTFLHISTVNSSDIFDAFVLSFSSFDLGYLDYFCQCMCVFIKGSSRVQSVLHCQLTIAQEMLDAHIC